MNDEEHPPVVRTERAFDLAVKSARQFERELLVAKLEAEMLQADKHITDPVELAWRKGWNARAAQCVAELRGRQ